MAKYILALAAVGLVVAVVLTLGGADIAGADAMWRSGPRTAPFQAVKWNDATPQVKVDDQWYELIAMNDFSADQIVSWCKQLDPKEYQKRFEEDLPEVMMRVKHELGETVSLKLKNL